MNEARYDHSSIVYNNKLFVFGGIGEGGRRINTVEMFSTEANEFVIMAPMKIARGSFACCRVGNLVYLVGGTTNNGKTKSVEIYNLDNDTWTDGVDFPVVEYFYDLHTCVVNNKLN